MTRRVPDAAAYDSAVAAHVLRLAHTVGGPLLAIDTAGQEASVCLVHPASGRIIEHLSPAASLPCEALVQTLADTLGQAGCHTSELKALVASIGPGSFTGLRVGLATLQGLALGGDILMYGASSLAILAASAGPGRVSPVCDARRGDVFAALYEVNAVGLATPCVADGVFPVAAWHAQLAAAAHPDLTLTGDMAATFAEAAGVPLAHAPRRAIFAMVQCAAAITTGAATPLHALLPRYLRVSEAERQVSGAAS